MFTDLVGYTAMAQTDESHALALLKKHRQLARPIFSKHRGREVKTTGDGFLVEFASALAATECAVEFASALRESNRKTGETTQVRIGIHVGDVVHEEGDVFGDAVNIASRIESLAEGGGICISQQAYDQVRNKLPFRFSKIEAPELKNVSVPIGVYRLDLLGRQLAAEAPEPDFRRRLAVLPLMNMSPDPNDEYLADGMTEELISTLSKIHGIDVISRTSVMQYKKNPKPTKEIFRELGSGTILEGSVRKAGKKLRVTIQMIDAKSDKHLWAESYNRELKDIFEIQTGIARQVADALRVRIRPSVSERIEEKPTSNTGAYTYYLKGRYYWNKGTLEDVKRAAGLFESALQEDPKFALGYVGLGDCYQRMTSKFGLEVERNRGEAKRMVARALELDPSLAEAIATRGLSLFFDFDLRGAEEEFRRATDLKPSYASAHQWYSQLLIAQQRWDEALAHIEKACELDPFSQIICLVHTFYYEAKRDYPAGLEFAKRAVELNPDDPSSHIELAWFYGKAKLMDEARREAEAGVWMAEGSFPYAQKGAAAMLAYLEGDKEKVRALLPALKGHIGKTYTAIRFIADLHFYLGENDEGFEWLERSWAEREFDLFYLRSNEFLDGVRNDPRYIRLLDRLGLG